MGVGGCTKKTKENCGANLSTISENGKCVFIINNLIYHVKVKRKFNTQIGRANEEAGTTFLLFFGNQVHDSRDVMYPNVTPTNLADDETLQSSQRKSIQISLSLLPSRITSSHFKLSIPFTYLNIHFTLFQCPISKFMVVSALISNINKQIIAKKNVHLKVQWIN